MGGGAPDHTTTTTELPAWAQPYAKTLLDRTGYLADQPMPVYAGQRSADMNGYQQASMGMVSNRALNGSQEIQAGSRNLSDTLNGGYLDQGNPYLQSQIDQGSQGVMRNYYDAMKGTDAAAAKNGVYGGSAWEQMAADNSRNLAMGLSSLESGMRYQNYNDERGRQMQAMGLAPTYGNQAYFDAQQLAGVGQQQYAYDQQKLDDYRNMWTEQAQSPYKQLDLLGNGIRAAVGGGSQQSSSIPGPNPYATAIGGGAALYGLLGNSK